MMLKKSPKKTFYSTDCFLESILFALFLYDLFFFVIIGVAIQARRRQVVSGREALLTYEGYMITDMEKQVGQAKVNSEIWNVRCDTSLKCGDTIKVIGVEMRAISIYLSNGKSVEKINPIRKKYAKAKALMISKPSTSE